MNPDSDLAHLERAAVSIIFASVGGPQVLRLIRQQRRAGNKTSIIRDATRLPEDRCVKVWFRRIGTLTYDRATRSPQRAESGRFSGCKTLNMQGCKLPKIIVVLYGHVANGSRRHPPCR